MNSLFRVPSRIGKKGTKFDFEISGAEAIHSAIEGKLVTLRWVRDGKSGGISKNVLATADGRAIWSAADVLELSVTLYRSGPASGFDAKEFKINVDEVVRAGAFKTLAAVKVDLSKFADKLGANKYANCELDLFGDEGRKGGIRFSISSALQGGLPSRTQTDRSQEAVQSSFESSSGKKESGRNANHTNGKKKVVAAVEAKRDKGKQALEHVHERNGSQKAATRRANARAKGQGEGMASWERRALGLASDSDGADEVEEEGGSQEDDEKEGRSDVNDIIRIKPEHSNGGVRAAVNDLSTKVENKRSAVDGGKSQSLALSVNLAASQTASAKLPSKAQSCAQPKGRGAAPEEME